MYQRGTIFPMCAGYATRKIKFTWPDNKIILIENGTILSEEDEIAETLNNNELKYTRIPRFYKFY